jgi:hypothetical protein
MRRLPNHQAGGVITMPKTSARNHRNNPYLLDDLFVRGKRTAAGMLWRFRTETITVLAVVAGFGELTRTVTTIWAVVALIGVIATLTALPWTRRFIIRRAWCVLSRHRIQKVCFETRMHTRSGRLPLVLRVCPTEVGERALIWCRAGICAEDFEAHSTEIAAACYAREARIEGNKQRAQLVTVHVVRRDTLAAHHVITPALAPIEDGQRDSKKTA